MEPTIPSGAVMGSLSSSNAVAAIAAVFRPLLGNP
jgi:hypothetical protein